MLSLRSLLLLSAALLLASPGVSSALYTVDFDSNGEVNGQAGPFNYSYGLPAETLTISADTPPPGNHIGVAIFDGSFGGPNDFGGPNNDQDLVVGSGNILILQNNNFPTQTVPGIFDTANDDEMGGMFFLDFSSPVSMTSIDLIDINGGGSLSLILRDSAANTRTYTVPDEWTGDIMNGYQGWDTLDLTSLLPQVGVGAGNPSTSVNEVGAFDSFDVVQVQISFSGSAGIDNISFVPEPSTALLVGLGLSVLGLRRKAA